MSRVTAGERLQRLLAIIPWVAAHDGPSIDEICERFEVKHNELVADLTLASMVGVYPFTPDELIEVIIDDGRVWVHYALSFDRPLRLTPEQALVLVAAGSGLLTVPGVDPDGPLARGLAKLARTLDVDADETIDIDLGLAPAAVLEQLQEASRLRLQVEIDYYSYGRDERTVRVVDPLRVSAQQGQWYLQAWDHLRGGERLFRVDRVRAVRRLESAFDRPAPSDGLASFVAEPDDSRVELELAPAARWVVDQYPVEAVEQLPGGRLRVTLAVGAQPWLERLLLRLGPDGLVIATSDDLASDVAAAAARRILARYEG